MVACPCAAKDLNLVSDICGVAALCCAAGKPLTKQQLLPEIGAFILAGFDTSSHTIAWCL
jgi:cytochrome P450